MLVAYYALDEAAMDSPDAAADSSGNGFNGLYYGPDAYGANTPVLGHLNNGMQVYVPSTYPDPRDLLGHAGMRVQAVTDFSFSGATDPFTVDFWVNLGTTDAGQRRGLIGAYDPAVPPLGYNTWGFWIEQNETIVRFFRGGFGADPRDEAITSSLTPGTWYEIKGSYDGTDLTVYLDGVLEDTTLGTIGALSVSAGSLSVGGGVPLQVIFGFKSFRYPPNGTILDEVKVYDTATNNDSATIAFYGGDAS